ncbi:hypothetical protein [Phycisphaera mikurensis]|uniref:hypothetical protein n=1 Tax=Phycisphaera mikurensis TaxID=547188 RepID=UPI00069F2D72|nr:hypothetical protein [Phycisphaera mikurensis]MBB6441401.1 hypothetical protein [Phycisphaera mikurensis]
MRDARSSTKARPAWLLAIGTAEPAAEVTIAGRAYRLVELLKADAFALTARYRPADGGGDAVVKRCRTQPALGVPFRWLGRRLADRERFFHRRLADLPEVPVDLGEVVIDDRPEPNAFARAWVVGEPLQRDARPGDGFFEAAEALVAAVHARGVALVDLDKADNFIVDPRGRPHLLDFQLALAADRRGFLPAWLAVRGLATQQRCDRYHLLKHRIRQRPDTVCAGDAAAAASELDALRPPWIRFWRRIWRPVILTRRRLLVRLGVRSGDGTAATEPPPRGRGGLRIPPRLPQTSRTPS